MYLDQKNRDVCGRNEYCIEPLLFFFLLLHLSACLLGFPLLDCACPSCMFCCSPFLNKLSGCPVFFSPLPLASLEIAIPLSEVRALSGLACLVQASIFISFLKANRWTHSCEHNRLTKMLKWPSGDCCIFWMVFTLHGLYLCFLEVEI